MSITAVSGLLLIVGGGICAAQPVPGLAGDYACGFDSTGYTPAETQESVDVSGIFSLAIQGNSVTQSDATLSVSDGGAGPAVCTYTSGSGSIANDPSDGGFDTATLTYEPSNTNSSLCPPGSATLTLTPVKDGINFVYANAAGFVGNGTCGPAGTPIASAFDCRYMISNKKGKGSGQAGVIIIPALERPFSDQRQVSGLAVDEYNPSTQCPYYLTGTAIYPVPDMPMQGEWAIGGPTLPGCPDVPAIGEVTFTTTKDTILVTSPQLSSVVCTVPPPVGFLQASPDHFDFGMQKVKTTTKSPAIKVTDAGAGPVDIPGVKSSNPKIFGETDNCKGLLQPGASCTITASFMPAAKGKAEGSLSVANNGKALDIKLVGTGI